MPYVICLNYAITIYSKLHKYIIKYKYLKLEVRMSLFIFSGFLAFLNSILALL